MYSITTNLNTFKYNYSIRMHFCINCENMYYIQLDANNPDALVYYCRKCGDINENITMDNVSISKIQLKKGEQQFNSIVNKYTKLDPTLPRIDRVLCPNNECTTNHPDTPTPREIIYIRYDDSNMKYIYLCSTCDTVWKI